MKKLFPKPVKTDKARPSLVVGHCKRSLHHCK